jgi:hypothetical protein
VSRTIKVDVPVKEEFILDVLVTACEGGITYWVEKARNIERGGRDGLDYLSLEVSPVETDTPEWRLISATTVLQGLTRILTGEVKVREDIAASVRNAVFNDDAGEIDSDGADVIVQAGLFNEIVYG